MSKSEVFLATTLTVATLKAHRSPSDVAKTVPSAMHNGGTFRGAHVRAPPIRSNLVAGGPSLWLSGCYSQEACGTVNVLYPISSSLIQGKANVHGHTLSRPITSYGNRTPVRLDYGSGDGQPQTCAAYPATARLVGTVEAIEDMGKVCGVSLPEARAFGMI